MDMDYKKATVLVNTYIRKEGDTLKLQDVKELYPFDYTNWKDFEKDMYEPFTYEIEQHTNIPNCFITENKQISDNYFHFANDIRRISKEGHYSAFLAFCNYLVNLNIQPKDFETRYLYADFYRNYLGSDGIESLLKQKTPYIISNSRINKYTRLRWQDLLTENLVYKARICSKLALIHSDCLNDDSRNKYEKAFDILQADLLIYFNSRERPGLVCYGEHMFLVVKDLAQVFY